MNVSLNSFQPKMAGKETIKPTFGAKLKRRVLRGGGNAETLQDIVILGGARTPFTTVGGDLREVSAYDMIRIAMQGTLDKIGLAGKKVNQVIIGNVIANDAQAAFLPRNVALSLGLRQGTTALGTNRLCGTGFEAARQAAHLLVDGGDSVILTGGVESMSQTPVMDKERMLKEELVAGMERKAAKTGEDLTENGIYKFVKADLAKPIAYENPLNLGLTDPQADIMIGTADRLSSREFIMGKGNGPNVTRDEADEYALRSQLRASAAQAEGRFDDEIVPVKASDIERGQLQGGAKEVTKDSHVRPGSTKEKLAKLAVMNQNRKDAIHTAGNSSGLVDGAAAMAISTGRFAKKHNLPVLAKINSVAVTGCDPKIMGYGPVRAIKEALRSADLTLDDVATIEINEAFSGQALACLKSLSKDHADLTGGDFETIYPDMLSKFNPDGGAIALGHPLSATGSRITLHTANRLKAEGKKFAVVSACIGGGQGIAMVIENPEATK